MKRFIALGLLLGASAALPGQTAPAAAKSPNSRMAAESIPLWPHN